MAIDLPGYGRSDKPDVTYDIEFLSACVAGVIEGQIPKGRRATGLFDPYFLDETDPVAGLHAEGGVADEDAGAGAKLEAGRRDH